LLNPSLRRKPSSLPALGAHPTLMATTDCQPRAAPVPESLASPPRPLESARRWALEVASLMGEFPDGDEGLVRGMLEDQGGDLADVRVMLRVRTCERLPRNWVV
jgi:hypothetical protein